jgi:hypothetical protein
LAKGGSGGLDFPIQFDLPVIIAVGIVDTVEVVADEVVRVLSVRYLRMSTAWPMCMLGRMPNARMFRRAALRVTAADLDHGAIEMISVPDVQLPVMEISGLIAVADGSVSAVRPIGMLVLLVAIVSVHDSSLR